MPRPRSRVDAALAVLATASVGIAGYLTAVHLAGVTPACTTGGCARVQGSRYSEIAGIPVAALGLATYLGLLATLAGATERARLATAGLAFVALAFSAHLTYLEAAVLHAWCQWCVASAVLTALIAPLAVARALREGADQRGDDDRQRGQQEVLGAHAVE